MHMLMCVKCALCHKDNSLIQDSLNPTVFRSTSHVSAANKLIIFRQYDIKIKLCFISFLSDHAQART